MKVINGREVFDFSNVESLSYRESVFGNGYPIEVKRTGGGLFNDAIEIGRVPSLKCASELVKALTGAWAKRELIFEIEPWVKSWYEKHPEDLPKKYREFVEIQNKVVSGLIQTKEQLVEVNQMLKDIEQKTIKTSDSKIKDNATR